VSIIATGTPAQIKQTIPGQVLELTPSDFARAQSAVENLEGILEVQTYGDKLHLFVDDIALRKGQIEARLDADGITHGDMREIEVRMEEAFISLVNKRTRGPLQGTKEGASPLVSASPKETTSLVEKGNEK
jgi:ABC-2 type transport system ATP-binding protein